METLPRLDIQARRKKGTHTAKVITVIETVTYVGAGTEEDPIQQLHQYWSMDGVQLAARLGNETIPYGIDGQEALKRANRRERFAQQQHDDAHTNPQ